MAKPSGSSERPTETATLSRRRLRALTQASGSEVIGALTVVSTDLTVEELRAAIDHMSRARREGLDKRATERETKATVKLYGSALHGGEDLEEDLTEEEWLQAELVVLGREAKALAASLDATRAMVEARCDLLLAGDGH